MNPFDKSFWNERYATDAYLYGTHPSGFLTEHAHRLAPGSQVLVPADGEGRNSVYLASLGHDVTATDISERALAKSRRLAEQEGVDVSFVEVDLQTWAWPSNAYDAVVGVFIQFAPPDFRAAMFAGMRDAIRPGGLVMLHGYTPRQIAYGTGGPPVVEHLYTEALLREAFDGWDIERLASYDRELSEGAGHSGMSALIDLIARRPA